MAWLRGEFNPKITWAIGFRLSDVIINLNFRQTNLIINRANQSCGQNEVLATYGWSSRYKDLEFRGLVACITYM
jgi:hypothetical protein